MASPSTVITMGYGNGTLAGSPSLVVTLGYGAGAINVGSPDLTFTSRPRGIVFTAKPRGTVFTPKVTGR